MQGDGGQRAGGSISFEHVSFSYASGSPVVLDDVCLDIEAGQFLAILGANGSGKSTLAKHMNALLVPVSGRVLVDGFDTADPDSIREVRERAGMVFQNPDNQAIASVVRDDVAFGPENLGLAPEEIRARVADALATVAMQDHALDEIDSLSGGQKQRVAIAGVLAMRPRILILDEPGAMLDARGRRGIIRVAHELNAQGMTVVLVTHFMEDALGADRVVVLDRGRIALQGSPQEVFTNASALRKLRLDLPFSVRLADDLRSQGFDVGLGLSEESLEEELCRSLSSR